MDDKEKKPEVVLDGNKVSKESLNEEKQKPGQRIVEVTPDNYKTLKRFQD